MSRESRSMIQRVLAQSVAGLFVLLTACNATGQGTTAQDQGSVKSSPQAAVQEQLGTPPANIDTATAQALSQTFRGAAARALPSVVYIEVEKTARPGDEQMQGVDPFEYFFGQPGPQAQPQPEQGSGSGFILDQQGHIITNAHVAGGADYVMVRLQDGREFKAKVVGYDESSDVAVIQINAGDVQLTPAIFGDSDKVQVGDWVLALGYPLGLDFTVTSGIVSAKGRQLPTGEQTALQGFIQTDAAINPGNSGGPLVDLTGKVIGMNTAIFGGPRFVGYGFSIPIDLVQRVVHDILQYGYVRRPQLGVSVAPVNAVDAEVYGLSKVAGAVVKTVSDDSPASRAGLEIGDVITGINGEPIANSADLITTLARMQPEQKVDLTIVRNKKQQHVTVTLGEFEHQQEGAEQPAEKHEVQRTLGFGVEPLTPQLAQRLQLEQTSGVVISSVSPVSGAANGGVRPGMLLLRINGQQVKTPADVQKAAQGINAGDAVSLRVVVPQLGETVINYRTR